ncbi:MAG: indolepyruvate ferredoxin oxidoreductase family protein [Gammaproteobacteria bacterium]|nr:indolepyruvate ferredoxin oxidoreductase family protein [Gammaproteobacteria bacterium]
MKRRADLFETQLSDKYTMTEGPIWINGTQVITRLLLEQSRLDTRNGLKTAGFVSGYRGSPLGGVDQALMQEAKLLKDHRIKFEPGVNEDLAATSVWGTQQANIYPTASYDGVFGLWYGKAPGVDRSGDVFRHANRAGSSKYGGVVALVGDDPACKSSTLPSNSIGALREFQIPVLTPTDIEDLINLGLAAWALSRYSGCWVALTAITAIMDSATTLRTEKLNFSFECPETELDPHIRLIDTPQEQELRIASKIALAARFGAVNNLNHITVDSDRPKLAILGVGKAYTDVRQALRLIGFADEQTLAAIGVRIVKIGQVWPLETTHVKELLKDVPAVLVVEGKYPYLEDSLKSILYGKDAPEIEGRRTRHGKELFPTVGEISCDMIVRALIDVFRDHGISIPRSDLALGETWGSTHTPANASRLPLYCPGCPHSVSTKIPEDSRALAGIGCHYMVQWMDRNTHTFTHMGGEGANWIGQAPFVDDQHIFVNLGDGTYFHSGLMAIRACVAAGVNVTYKILYNDAVAMTGGQAVEGDLTVDDIVRQVLAENVSAVHIVTDDPRRYEERSYEVSHRDDLNRVQEQLRQVKGCTILIYDQVCANELRRRRKRGLIPKKMKRVVINDAVCEGCGDCTRASMCSAIEPIITDLGVKRKINQTACNQDLSCMQGYCPAMIEIEAELVEPETVQIDLSSLPNPTVALPTSANILVAGVGGTGVVTLSQVLGMAATIEGKHASNLDMTGLAQKGGAVFANVRISDNEVLRTQISERETDVLLGSDLVTSLSQESVTTLDNTRTNIVVNTHLVPTSKFVLQRQADIENSELVNQLAAFGQTLKTIDADRLSVRVSGASTTANMTLLGYAWQLGLIPLKAASIEQALTINATLVKKNILAFRAGRKFALDSNFLDISGQPEQAMFPKVERTLPELIDDRIAFLTEYQDAKYAARLQTFADKIQNVEKQVAGDSEELSRLAVETYFKLLATKDEYEVARLLTHPNFQRFMDSQFTNVHSFQFAFAPTWLPRAQKSKVRVDSWVRVFLRLLAKFKVLRGTILDPFKHIEERKFERKLLRDFDEMMNSLITNLKEENFSSAIELIRCYSEVRGYGHVKQASWDRVAERVKALKNSIITAPEKATQTDSVEA